MHLGVKWDFFPEDVEYVRPDEEGFRGFVVEIYNVISDVVVQDGYQFVLNLRTVLNQISMRHPRIRRCSRETDGARGRCVQQSLRDVVYIATRFGRYRYSWSDSSS